MKNIFYKILNEYTDAKKEPFAGHSLATFFRNDIPNAIYGLELFDKNDYLVTGSVGKGNWADCAWFAIFYRDITQSAQEGIYIVYLLSKDGNSMYLTLNQGSENIRKNNTKKYTITYMRDRAKEIIRNIGNKGFNYDENIDLGENLTERAEMYQKGTILYKKYDKENLPSDDELIDDLSRMLEVYNDYIKLTNDENNIDSWWPSKDEYDPKITKDEWLNILKNTDVLGSNIKRMLAAMCAEGGMSTCSQLALKYGNTTSHYIMTAVHASERTYKYTKCNMPPESKNSKWWPIMFVGKNADGNQQGNYIWKIREELMEAITEYDISCYLESSHSTGIYDSWEIINEYTAIKTCDKSFFEHNGSGIPKDICWFFNAENLKNSETKHINIVLEDKIYTARVSADAHESRRVRLFWNIELAKEFNKYSNKNAKAVFIKKDVDLYEITFSIGDTIVDNELIFKTSYKHDREFLYHNRILFGAPGTGKSFTINKESEILLINDGYQERVTFHPDYSYATFVGTYKPVMVSKTFDSVNDAEKEVISILVDKTKSAQEKYDLLYERFKDDGLTRLPILLGLCTDENFKTKKQDGSYAANDNSVERNHGRSIRPYVTLHTNTKSNEDITYEYVPGPFMRVLTSALKSAMSDNPKPHLLIIEEINRANVAAVFGDVFQLLDRDNDGVSEYSIQTSNDMRDYLAKELDLDPSKCTNIRIPNNMFIWATMNSADQGVFPMDTAFKRRWNFEYLDINDGEDKIIGKTVTLGQGDDERKVEWNDLRIAINDFLVDECRVNEDKLLGPFFIYNGIIKEDEDIDNQAFINIFKNKVLMYLFEDAAKQKRQTLFEGVSKYNLLSSIMREFDTKGINIFNKEISNKFTKQTGDDH